MASEILIIRHGETTHNAARIVQPPDVRLSDRGEDQAHRLGRRLAAEGPLARILASDLTRAAQTAEAAAGATGAPITWTTNLHERNFGELRGTPYAELETDIFAPDYDPPGGESIPMFVARVQSAWAEVVEIAKQTEGRLAVVTHGLVCAAMLTRHCALDDHSVPGHFGNTCVSSVEPAPPWRVGTLACTRHLDDEAHGGGAV